MSNAVEDHFWSETLRPYYHISSFLIAHLPTPNQTNNVSRQQDQGKAAPIEIHAGFVFITVHASQELNPSTTTTLYTTSWCGVDSTL